MKRICFFPGTLGLGGIGKLFINLIEEYSARGIAVDVFLTKREGEYLEQLPEGVRIFEGSGRALTSVPTFIKYLYKEKPDAVISAREFLNLINILCCASAFGKIKTVVTLHTNQTAENFYSNNDISLYNKKWFINFAKRMNVSPEKIKVIYNPVYKPYDDNGLVSNSKYEEFVKANRNYIIAVGRFVHQKDFTTLINAFKLVRNEKDVSLIMLGDGPLRTEIEQQIKELSIEKHVLLMGFVSNPLFYIKRSSALVVSSKFEGFGNIIVEALGVGTPVVSTDCQSGPREILENGKYGKLVPVQDPELMAKAIIDTLSCKQDISLILNRAKDFAVPKIADEYLTYIGLT